MSEPTGQQLVEWQEWLAERPPNVRAVAERLPPWRKYWLTTTGQHARVVSYEEDDAGDVTVSIHVWRDWHPVEWNVFGVDPESLAEGDPPSDRDDTDIVARGIENMWSGEIIE